MPPYTKSPNSDIVIYGLTWANQNNLGQNRRITGGTTDPNELRVLNRFFAAIDRRRPALPADNQLFEADPAPGARKIGTIEYARNAQSHGLKQTVYEYECFNFRYHITEVYYHHSPLTDWNVIDRINRALRGAAMTKDQWIPDYVTIGNSLFGFDPAPGLSKAAYIQVGWDETPGCQQMKTWYLPEGMQYPKFDLYHLARQKDDDLNPRLSVRWNGNTPQEMSWSEYVQNYGLDGLK